MGTIRDSLAQLIGGETTPVVSSYRVGLLILEANQKSTAEGAGEPKDDLTRALYENLTDQLLKLGILRRHPDLPLTAFRLFGRRNEDPAEVACTADPFCYVSHLSAMAHHGLTDRLPAKLFLSTPAAAEWKRSAVERMQKDLGSSFEAYLKSGLPTLTWRPIAKLGKTEVHIFHSKHQGAFKLVRDNPLRVSTIGRTFLDMLRNPELCGGLHHVLDVYEEHARTWLAPITDEIDRHGAPIDKVRAGYILEERMGLESSVIEGWTKCAQRGGSRKLDASAEYRPVWSEKWCLSLNID